MSTNGILEINLFLSISFPAVSPLLSFSLFMCQSGASFAAFCQVLHGTIVAFWLVSLTVDYRTIGRVVVIGGMENSWKTNKRGLD